MNHPRHLLFAAFVAMCGNAAIAADQPSGPPCVPGQPGRGGIVTEHSRQPNATFIVHLTDFNYQDIPGADLFPPSIPDGAGGTTIVPLNVPAMDGLCDARNETLLPPLHGGGAGGRSDLSIESVFYNPDTQRFELLNIWGTIAQQLGEGASVAIPDLYIADANGVLDDHVLYSLVDLAVYTLAVPSFAEGDVFDIVNGQVAGLPGMYFSTTPFSFDSLTGFSDPPYTGRAIAETQHGFTTIPVIPEPATMTLLAAGLAGLFVARQRWPGSRR